MNQIIKLNWRSPDQVARQPGHRQDMDYTFIKNRDFILFSSQPWEADLGSNFKDIARELAKFNRVLFVNRALDRVSLIKDKGNPELTGRLASVSMGINSLEEIQPGLWIFNPRTILESINWIPVPVIHDMFNRLNNRRLANQINKTTAQLGFTDAILINDNDFIRGRYLKEMVTCTTYIFYKRDDMLGIKYFQRHGPRLQAELLKEADMVATNSAYLADIARVYNQNSFDIGQGCDLDIFHLTQTAAPVDILDIKKPVIGYTGYISAWRIDVDMIKYLAERLPACNFVLIGPVDVLFRTDTLKEFRNIHFISSKPPSELPQYIDHFDICINPQVLNAITIGNYPRKIDEYLAMGKPVVATKTEAMELFDGHVWLCNDKVMFAESIREILANPGKFMSQQARDKRIQFARTHTWESSMGRLGNAYLQLKRNDLKTTGKKETHGLSAKLQQTAAILFVVAYLLFVYIKFIFY